MSFFSPNQNTGSDVEPLPHNLPPKRAVGQPQFYLPDGIMHGPFEPTSNLLEQVDDQTVAILDAFNKERICEKARNYFLQGTVELTLNVQKYLKSAQ